jgi:hypothetical protein
MTFLPLLLIFWGVNWQPKCFAIGLFETFDTFGHTFSKDLTKLLGKYDLTKKSWLMLKLKNNLNTMTIALKSIISCDVLGLTKSFHGSYFGHAFFEACKYASTDEKVYKGLKYVFVKIAQYDQHKCITWSKKSRKGRQEWNNACADSNISPRKPNSLVKTKLS